jgi:hypothetical protein
MNSNAVVIALCSLSLGATCYLVASLPKGADERVADLERKLDAAEKRAAAVESLRTEVREMKEKIDRRAAETPRRVEAPSIPSDLAAAPGMAPARADASSSGKPLEDVVAERVEKKVAEKLDAMAARDRERGEDGKWKAPLDDLAQELKLTDAQKAEAKRIFEHSRDEAFTLLKTQRLDGGSILDDYAAALKSGADPTETTKQLFSRIFTERVPGSDRTYLAEFVTMHQNVEEQLGGKLDAGQMKRLRALHVDLLDVKTGYDPVGDYVRAKVQ